LIALLEVIEILQPNLNPLKQFLIVDMTIDPNTSPTFSCHRRQRRKFVTAVMNSRVT